MRKTDIDIKYNEEKVRSGDLKTMKKRLIWAPHYWIQKFKAGCGSTKTYILLMFATMIKMLKHCFDNIESISFQNKDPVRILYMTLITV